MLNSSYTLMVYQKVHPTFLNAFYDTYYHSLHLPYQSRRSLLVQVLLLSLSELLTFLSSFQ